MEYTFTTEVTEAKNGVEIVTLHDQTGSASIGFVPTENILSTIEKLRNFIGFNLPVSGSVCEHEWKSFHGQWNYCIKCDEVQEKEEHFR